MTQPALTRAIQKLEEELGGLLLHRERNLTHLTDLGRLMRPHLEEILAEAETARSAARRFLRLDSAPLKLGVMCTIGPMRFAAFLGRLRTDHPGVELTLLEATPSRLTELVVQGEVDLAIMAQPEPFDDRLVVQHLYDERFMLAFPAGHHFEKRNSLTFRDVAGENYLSRINCEYADRLGELCRTQGVAVQRVYRSEREDWIQSMVAAGLGICFLPEFSATIAGVMTRKVVDPEVHRQVSLVSMAGRRHSAPVAAFVKAAKAHRWRD